MKKIILFILSVCILNVAIAQDGLPGTWNQNTAYSSGSLVISNGSTYLAQQAVPSGTALTSTAYWLSLDSAVPTSTPGSAPTSTPDVSSAPTATPASEDDNTATPSASRFLGISTRGPVTVNSFLHAGIIINGVDVKTVIFMAKGPLLTQYGVPGALADPLIEIYDATGAKIFENDSWSSPIGNQNLSVYNGKPGIAMPVDAAEAGIAVSLSPGAYTAVVKGAGGSEGIALVEAYEVSGETPSTSFLGISTRGPVTASSYLHAGLAVEGTVAKRVAFMAKGPLLTQYGVPGALANPMLEIYDVTGAKIHENDSWGTATGDQSILTYNGKPGISQPVDALE
ncbi:MAG: hypothetical protein P8O23_10305, partial [Opitutales bacterium]|nr:hypothetical protein [Opitutales bacterium]